ncbi:type II secretion system protein [Bacillus sp. REN3]|uniref:type IV pilus modification PilV family protein n=1 Tax=Bacillus sp. REN3 TaxID=2802440 RepID=UPI001AEDFD9C|nr:type II secretion system protein [Bacillus sp. REN3]
MLADEKGVTLVEILLSIVILSFVLISVMNLFPQAGLLIEKNETKSNGIHAARELLASWQGSMEAKVFLEHPSEENRPASFVKEEGGYYFFQTDIGEYIGEIRIKKAADLDSAPAKPHLVHIKVLDQKNEKISETHGYLIVDQ